MGKSVIEFDRMIGTSLPGESLWFELQTDGLKGETTLSAGEKGCPDVTPSPRGRHGFANIVGKSVAMQGVYDLISKAAATDANVVIYGESGTGKELVAQAIHQVSHRRDKAFVPVNCGAIPETLLESEFFGHRKGAFTGAYIDKHGYLDLAHGGTLFLDEVGDLSLNIQVKLLRAIECKKYFPVGSNRSKSSDFRIIAATNSDLMEKVRKGLMREDFFYRIHVIPITLPPLRYRKEDVPLLIAHFLESYGNGTGRASLPEKIKKALYNYDWPGNVRELQNVLHRYLTVGTLDFTDCKSPSCPAGVSRPATHDAYHQPINLRDAVERLERELISRALAQTRWNRTKAARLLGISRRALFRKMSNLGIK